MELPVVIIGAGPVGLAAAAHLLERGLTPLILEAGPSAGTHIRAWGHVRLFSPWRYCIDRASRALLEASGWQAPDPKRLPTGAALVEEYVEPLAGLLAPHLRFNRRVVGVSRDGFDKVRSAGRNEAPFVIVTRTPEGTEDRITARAVIDASGTWSQPNPLGASGLPALGEDGSGRVRYGIPNVLGPDRAAYAGRRVLVVGAGHSAMNAVQDLVKLKQVEPGTEVFWAMRRAPDPLTFGGGAQDALIARGQLGAEAEAAVTRGDVTLLAPFPIEALAEQPDGVRVTSVGGQSVTVDRIIACTGFRPDLAFLREVRLGLDSWLETTPALAPLIDPNLHSCGTVRPHGAAELAHPEPGFYAVGMKSYGRAPTFLLLTGYEQVRSVAAALAGDSAAAARVELDLPETGVCITQRTPAKTGCCG
ncbi:FAD-dependent oxidoreductase [Elstera cyanobacteriorum]|uniref:FAD-dependent oxidoreductase n=1 Tax=Elstera cyanobacteriorum TaxID=2022747 RepID=UPI002354E310|nr:FAD-dependent oxidoreductase [Elstera cyanobacteriorum]MCK6443164.1 NAD(P)-binding domain-containing protein [Elstera cyanobacteriorum]